MTIDTLSFQRTTDTLSLFQQGHALCIGSCVPLDGR